MASKLIDYLMENPLYAYGQRVGQQGADVSPVSSPWQGIARALQGGVGGLFEGQAMAQAKKEQSTDSATLAAAMQKANDGDLAGASAALATRPHLQDYAQTVAGQQLAYNQNLKLMIAKAEFEKKQAKEQYDAMFGGGGAAPGAPATAAAPGGTPSAASGINNPVNIENRAADAWQGATPATGRFVNFQTPEHGVRAADINLRSYAQALGPTPTLRQVVERHAPGNENNVGAYLAALKQSTGLNPDDPVNLADPATRAKIIMGMTPVEKGVAASRFTPEVFQRGFAMAGHPPPPTPGAAPGSLPPFQTAGNAMPLPPSLGGRAPGPPGAPVGAPAGGAAPPGLPQPSSPLSAPPMGAQPPQGAAIAPARPAAPPPGAGVAMVNLHGVMVPQAAIAPHFAPGTTAAERGPKLAALASEWAVRQQELNQTGEWITTPNNPSQKTWIPKSALPGATQGNPEYDPLKIGAGLRGEINGNQLIQEARKLEPVIATMRQAVADPSRVGDVSLISGVANMLAPQSARPAGNMVEMVKGSETLPGRLRSEISKLNADPKAGLDPAFRAELLHEAESHFAAMTTARRRAEAPYVAIAKQHGVPLAHIGLDEPPPAPPPFARAAPKGKTAADFDR